VPRHCWVAKNNSLHANGQWFQFSVPSILHTNKRIRHSFGILLPAASDFLKVSVSSGITRQYSPVLLAVKIFLGSYSLMMSGSTSITQRSAPKSSASCFSPWSFLNPILFLSFCPSFYSSAAHAAAGPFALESVRSDCDERQIILQQILGSLSCCPS